MNFRTLKNLRKRVATIGFTTLMCLSCVGAPIAKAIGDNRNTSKETQRVVSFTDVTDKINLSDIKLENLSEYVMANVDMHNYENRAVIVNLKEESLVESANGKDVLEYSSSISGKKQKNLISAEQNEFLGNLAKMGIDYNLITKYDTVLNGVAINVNTAYVSLIKLLPNVESVVLSETYMAPQTATEDGNSASTITNQTSVYETGIYDSSKYADEYGGKGMVVAVLDTGLDYTHEAFLTQPSPSDMKLTESDVYALMQEKDFSALGDVYVSDKVPFAYDYADRDSDVYPSYSNHGTHVAGIIAGSADSYTDKDGFVPTEADGTPKKFVSVAPHAQLVICKVFTDNLESKDVGGATTQNILDALDDCVKLGVDVINMSLGTTCGFSTTNDGDAEGELMHKTYQFIQDAGISLMCAASNDYSSAYGGAFGTNLTSNPDSGTVGSPSTFTAALSVASISGKKSPYVLANDKTAVFYNESSDENNVDYDFAERMLEGATSKDFKYLVIKGTYYGSSADYNTSYVKRAIKSAHDNGEKIIALVKRGGNLTFQEKVENAMGAGADAIIVYNNVAGEIKMTIGDVDNPIPAISISYEAGEEMVKGASSNIGTITINPKDYVAGPFMSNFSSWGVTPDLKLKPEITAHGGEITSAVPGGWDEQSGTSMATPNVAGLVANIRSYITKEWNKFFKSMPNSKQITQLTNQLMMSTATIVVDQKALAYSPRKQGAGLASLENIIDYTNAYLYTVESEQIISKHGNYYGSEDNRPKLELGEDEQKKGEYTLSFYVNNLSSSAMSFALKSIFMTESVSLDGLAVGEQAHMLNGNAVWTIDGNGSYSDGEVVSIKSGVSKISVTLTLSRQEKAYIDKNFANGMYVEGFLQLQSKTTGQCNLSIPFLGFYGDWESAPMLDYDAFEIAKIEQDTSILEDEKPKASVWATQAYSLYWNDRYVLPMGSFVYAQDESDEVRKIYTTEEHSAISCYNEYLGDDENNYMTSTGIKGVYAGLLRNAKQVDCRMYNVATGELIYNKEIYRVNKAYSNGGGTTPGFVKLELTPAELGLVENGQYRMEFDFHYKTPDENTIVDEENTFKFSFYVDYTAPVLEEARIRYFDYKQGNKTKQKIYLDLDVYDNHYSMAALLCYLDSTIPDNQTLQLCTEYITPIYDAKKNGTTTISIEITDIVEKYGDNLYVELDDYALNHSVYKINVGESNKAPLPDTFNLAEGEENITIGKYETHKVNLTWNSEKYPNANISNFTWSVTGKSASILAVKNGEIVGLAAGVGTVNVSNGFTTKEIQVTVVDNNKKLNIPSISFDVILNDAKAPVKAQGVVDVNIAQDIKLEVLTDPWYYSLVSDLELEWTSYDTSVATVDQLGNVKLLKKGKASIVATIKGTAYSATVMLNVQEPFKVANYTLSKYEGAGGTVYIPTDMNIMNIGEEAFKNNTKITSVIIPKTVRNIEIRAFYGCTNLKHVFFVDVETQEIAESDLTLINREAFYGCTSLEILDFSNCKTFTVARNAFGGCTSLKLIKGMEHIGTAYDYAFAGCTSLIGSIPSHSGVKFVNSEATLWDTINNRITYIETIDFENLQDKNGNNLVVSHLDISGLHVCGSYVFQGCESIVDIKTAQFTAIGPYMFANCKGLRNIVLNDVNSIGRFAFEKCFGLRSVTFKTSSCEVGDSAFSNCGNLNVILYETTDAGIETSITAIGNYAFSNTSLDVFTIPNGIKKIGNEILSGTGVSKVNITSTALGQMEFVGNPFKNITVFIDNQVLADDVIYNANFTKLVYVNPNANLDGFIIPATVIEIGEYAFADTSIKSIVIPASVKYIRDGAFKNSKLEQITFASSSVLESIGKEAFYGTKISQIIIPSSIKEVGDFAFANSSIADFVIASTNDITFGNSVFANCQSLVEIDLSDANVTKFGSRTFANAVSLTKVTFPSVKELGMFTFMGAMNITTVIFGEDSTTVGEYTFFNYSYNGSVMPYTKLNSVTIGAKTTSIGINAFTYCSNLESFDLRNVISVDDLAFYNCTGLTEIDGLDNVESIGMHAFYGCKGLRTLNLENVLTIGEGAFRIERSNDERALLVTINMPKVQSIGAYAFYGTGASTITLPETISEIQYSDVYNVDGGAYGSKATMPIGVGAFANAINLVEIKVAKQNKTYFDDGGVLYRYITNDTYELVSYPTLYKATEYVVKDGTVRIESYAFANARLLTKVTLPYSIKAIGAGAFYGSVVDSYIFESHYAPILESEFDGSLKEYLRQDISFRGMYYNNFFDYVIQYTDEISSIAGGNVSVLSMTYPKNGNGYTNYIYKKYFTASKQGDYVLTADARTVKDNVEGVEVETISAWLENTFVVNTENKQLVQDFAAFLKETHRLYNNVANDKNQCKLIGQNTIDKLFEIEEVMRQVKAKFGVSTYSTGYSFGGNYKKNYVEGEKFDITGLVITIIYDDYSTQDFTGENLQLASELDRPLTIYDRLVKVNCNGQTFNIDVSVSEKPNEPIKTPIVDQEKGEDNTLIYAIIGGASGVLVVGAIVMVILIKKGVIKFKKSNKNEKPEEQNGEENN